VVRRHEPRADTAFHPAACVVPRVELFLQVDRRDVGRDAGGGNDGLKALERDVDFDDLGLLFLLLLRLEVHQCRIHEHVGVGLGGPERGVDRPRDHHAVKHERYEAHARQAFAIRLAVGLDEVLEHRPLPATRCL
jgi:hypothetical protein